MTEHSIDPPGGIPEETIQLLEESSDRQLREIIHFAQQLLLEAPSGSAEIEPREGDEIVRIDDMGAYTIVVVERPDESGEDEGRSCIGSNGRLISKRRGVTIAGTTSAELRPSGRVSDVSESFFRRVVVPVANREDAAASAVALAPYVEAADATVFAVHVIEKAGGALDKASVEQRELQANEIFADFTQNFADVEADLETRILYGTNIAETIIEAAHDLDASAIVFTPRGGGR